MGALTQIETSKRKSDTERVDDRVYGYLRVAFWFVAGITGFLQNWLQDRNIWADTVSYLDSGSILWQGDFKNAITGHWSPGYPFILGLALAILHPAGLWEVAVVKLVNMIIFLFSIYCFDFFINQFCKYHQQTATSDNRPTGLLVPKAAIAMVGYLLFLWTITHLLFAWFSTPDMLVMGITFVVFGQLLKIRMGETGVRSFIFLGVVLGFGYLVKAPFFVLAFMFFGVAFLLVGNRKKAIRRVLVSFGVFALIAAPLLIRVSATTGKLTFGTSGLWNYARTVDGIALPYHWRGQPAGTGKPLHPTRIIFQAPTVYEFGSPVRGTFPPWRDPYYWFEGITPHFDLHGQWRALKVNAKILKEEASGLNKGFIYGFLVLLCMSSDRRLAGRIIAEQWFLILPSIATLAMFSAVLVEDRYIAPYPIVIGLVVFSAIAIVKSEHSIRLVKVTVLLAAALFALSSAKAAEGKLLLFGRSLHGKEILGRAEPWHVSTEAVSDALKAHGLQRGDRIAYIGSTGDFYWARLAGMQVNAEIRQWDLSDTVYRLVPYATLAGLEHSVDIYWASPSDRKEKIDHALCGVGSKAIVTDAFPAGGATSGWDRVPGTSYYIHLLPDCTENVGK